MNNNALIVKQVKQWLEEIIIGLNLCPFAKRELINDRIRFTVSHANTETELLATLLNELSCLENHPEIETILLIHPDVLTDFYDYNDFLDNADQLLIEHDYDGLFQIASFHPDYQFADTEIDDNENYTNRSPYPLLHILREQSLESAIESYGDTTVIPKRNIDLMNSLGTEKIQALFKACLKAD